MPPDATAAPKDVLALLAAEAEKIVEPLVRGAQHEEGRRQLLLVLGWDLEKLTGYPVGDLVEAASDIGEAAAALAQVTETPPEDLQGMVELIERLAELVDGIRALEGLADAASGTLPDDVVTALGTIGESLVEFLVLEYLSRYHPVGHGLARTLTVIDASADSGTALLPAMGGVNGEPLYRRPASPPAFRLDRLTDLLTDPAPAMRAVYLGPAGLTTVDGALLAASRLYQRLAPLLAALGGGVSDGSDDVGAEQRDARRTLAVRFALDPEDPDALFGVVLQLLSDEEGGARLVVSPTGWITHVMEGRSWAVGLQATGQAGEFSIGRAGVTLPSGAPAIKLGVTVERFPQGGGGPTAVGAPTGTRLELGPVTFGAEVQLSAKGWDVEVEFRLHDSALAISGGDADGFLSSVLPADGVRFGFDVAIAWSRRKGLRLAGAASLEADFPVHASLLGVLTVDVLTLSLSAEPEGVTAGAGATVTLTLGPLTATVQRFGLTARATFPTHGGNMGSLHLVPGFLPPRGIGMVVDALAVQGGGFILNDHEHGRYAGILELDIADVVSVTAIGLLSTRMPDGSEGFSLLIILTAEFPPIQLGFGFALSGLGGVLGLNRTMNLPALREGARTGVLDSILFPVDPVARADKVISDVESVFPVAPGRFTVGLMARLGWGTPQVIIVDLGVVIELPAPVRIVLLGRLTVVLPDPDVAVVELHLDVIGIVDVSRGELSIDATLHDSRIAVFDVYGDMALRVGWGATPAFAVSVGGFNPRFTPPPGFPQLRRLTIALAAGDNPRVRLECYLGTTANSVQTGARLDAHAELDAGVLGHFSADAYLGFDVLVVLVPFQFIVDLAGGVVIKRNGSPFIGATLLLTLFGPQPLRATGYAEVHFLGTHRIPIEITVGDDPAEAVLAAVDPLAALLHALVQPDSWAAQPPDGVPLVALGGPAGDTDLVAHPRGALGVRQRVVPLGLPIERFGGAPLVDGPRSYTATFRIGATTVTGDAVRDAWAPGDLFSLSDDEKLSRPSFEHLVAGSADLGTPPPAHGTSVAAGTATYETSVIDTDDAVPRPAEAHTVPDGVRSALRAGAAAAMAARSGASYLAPAQRVTVTAPGYVVASTATLQADSGEYPSWIEAHTDAADRSISGAAGAVQVLGVHEVVAP